MTGASALPVVLVININPGASTRNGTRRIARAFERLARRAGGTSPSYRVLVRHYARLRVADVDRMNPAAVVLGPQGVPFDAYPDSAALFGLIAHLAASGRPLLGICGGHQALVLAHGGAIGPVHGGRASGTYHGLRKESGLRHVSRVGDGGLVGAALDGDFVVSHVEGVTELPSSFELIGQGDPCRVQAVRLSGRPVWGLQFHPERGAVTAEGGGVAVPSNGERVLVAFLKEARLLGRPRDDAESSPR